MMTDEEKIAVHLAIHTASVAAAGIGGVLIFPGSDSVPLVGVQTTMAVAIAKALGLTLSQGAGEAAVATGLATMGGKFIAGSLTGMIPGIGPFIKGATAAGITEALGWTLASEFDAQRQ